MQENEDHEKLVHELLRVMDSANLDTDLTCSAALWAATYQVINASGAMREPYLTDEQVAMAFDELAKLFRARCDDTLKRLVARKCPEYEEKGETIQ